MSDNCQNKCENDEFLEEIFELFKKYPEAQSQYAISSKKLLNKLNAMKNYDQTIIQRWDGDRIVIELDSASEKSTMGCCQWCSEEDVVYCCVSGPDC